MTKLLSAMIATVSFAAVAANAPAKHAHHAKKERKKEEHRESKKRRRCTLGNLSHTQKPSSLCFIEKAITPKFH
ncbi:MAG: hypothetical protein PHI11_04695 [Gallionella sp.]|nr:hypothetical protein [Gallionella sp.]